MPAPKILRPCTAATVALLVSTTSLSAAICDYRPSRLVGDTVSGAAKAATGAVAQVTGAQQDGGFYTLVNATSGLTLLGGKLAASGGAAASLLEGGGAAAAAAMANPMVWVPALILGAGGAGYEATCAYFVDERITDYDHVLMIMRDFEAHSDPRYFRLEEDTLTPFIEIHDESGSRATYRVEDLYIVDGMLKLRSWGPNRKIGRVVFVPDDAPSEAVPEGAVEQVPMPEMEPPSATQAAPDTN
ncbi:hypothetical protein [Alloyangia pacifica]|uniref:Uncharacterized protein n=1 Tax=Alloyangia pacifica TaxID=311180 RepID=A0A1I6W395_9RHOB|nr:hypothetical protein [Alloyangia pacifica]SDI38872.1 hypothetical protein SAMN04488245_11570 [Alloyangia pacifica]SFT20104.1 hypothetical protein SAMN04488050_11471 [Alloyangia pacifica]